jgi:hypothetical protein
MVLVLQECSPSDAVVKSLLCSLSDELFQITGNDGTASFSEMEVL